MQKSTKKAVEIIWDHLQLHQGVVDSDALVVLGSRDDRVAVYAAGLMKRYSYKYIVISGGVAHKNDLLATEWGEESEAEHFYGLMRRHGLVQPVQLEVQAENTGDNAIFSHKLLADNGISPKTITIVTKPYMERRALATFEAQWPNEQARLYVTSSGVSFDDYIGTEQPADIVVNIMVGDLQRIMKYPRLGLSSKQPIPSEVWSAFERLVAAGYDKRLVN